MPTMTTTQNAVDIKNLEFSYSKNSKPVLIIPNWQIKIQEHVFLYGPSGSGKSTLLNLLSGIIHPKQGTIELLGTDFTALSARKKDQFRAKNIGVVFQEFNLIPYLSLRENLSLTGHFASVDKNTLNASADDMFSQLDLSPSLLSAPAHALSVGQRQRVAIARALVTKPPLLIADEPTSALDTGRRNEFMELLLNVANTHETTVIFVSHDMSLSSFFTQTVNLTDINQVQEVVES